MKKYKSMNVLFASIMAVVLVIGAAACAPAAEPTPTTPPTGETELPVKEVTFGGAIPISGPAAPWGIAIQNGAQLMIEDIATRGGIKTEDAIYNIKWLSEDSGVSAESGRLAYESLVFQHKVKFVFGPLFASMMPGVVPVLKEGNAMNFAYTMSPERLGSDRPYCFGFLSDYQYMIPLHVKWLKEEYPEIELFGHIQANDESGKANTPHITAACEANGIEIITEVYERNQQDFYPLLTRLLAHEPDCLGLVWSDGEAGMIVKQAREMGYEGPLYDINPHDSATIIELAGVESAEGFMFPCVPTKGAVVAPGAAALSQRYFDTFGSMVGFDVGLAAYDGIGIVAAAIEQAGSIDVDKVAQALESLVYTGVRGEMQFGGSKLYGISHQIAQSEYLGRIQNGELVGVGVVTPDEIIEIIGE